MESSVGAHLANAQARRECRLFYWREGDREIDFVVELGNRTLLAIEVRSGTAPLTHRGMDAFNQRYHPTRMLMIGEGGQSIEDFLASSVSSWMM